MLIVASANVVHNLGGIEWGNPEGGNTWARRLDEDSGELMLTDPASPEPSTPTPPARPTPDHFLPLAYLAGRATASGEPGTQGFLTILEYSAM